MPDRATEKLKQAKELKRAFRLREAVEYFNEAAQIDPACTVAWAQGGLCLLILGDPEAAVSFLDQGFKSSAFSDVAVGAYLAAALSAENKEAEAEKAREKCLSADAETDFAEPYMLVAEMMAAKDKFPEALRLLDILSSVLSQSPWFAIPRNHYRLICVLADAGVIDVAAFLAESLAERGGWEGLAARSAVLQAQKKYAEAFELIEKAAEQGGNDDPLILNRRHWLALNK